MSLLLTDRRFDDVSSADNSVPCQKRGKPPEFHRHIWTLRFGGGADEDGPLGVASPVYRFRDPFNPNDSKDEKRSPAAHIGKIFESQIVSDYKRREIAQRVLDAIPLKQRFAMLKRAARYFMNGTLDCGGIPTSPDQYRRLVSSVTGTPEAAITKHMQRICEAMTRAEEIARSLLAKFDPTATLETVVTGERKWMIHRGPIACVLPNNSPGVHVLWAWLAAFVPLLIKSGSTEVFTPDRMIAAMRKAGFPPEMFGLYHGDPALGGTMVKLASSAIVFGSDANVAKYAGNAKVQVHGAGFSKIVIDAKTWRKRRKQVLDAVFKSFIANWGKSCTNVSEILTEPGIGKEVARALAARVRKIKILPPDHPDAVVAAFPDPSVAKATWEHVSEWMNHRRIINCTSSSAGFPDRFVQEGRAAYLLPVVAYDGRTARYAIEEARAMEFLFPFVIVRECPLNAMVTQMGKTLVCSVFSEDAGLRAAVVAEGSQISRVHLSTADTLPSTVDIDLTAAHEGNIWAILLQAA